MDESVLKNNFINFNVCTPTKTMKISKYDQLRIMEPRVSKFSKPSERWPILHKRRKKIGECEVILGQLVLAEAECLASRRMLLSEGSMPRRSVSSR